MLVRARSLESVSESLERLVPIGQRLFTVGREYDVICLACSAGRQLVQIVDDDGRPAWFPLGLFEVVDDTLDTDWRVGSYPATGLLVVGPWFIARSEDAYRAMVELAPESVDLFWKRVDASKLIRLATSLQPASPSLFDDARRDAIGDLRSAIETLCAAIFDAELTLDAQTFDAIEQLAKRYDVGADNWEYLPRQE